jgi:quinol monooxygenase YgiN
MNPIATHHVALFVEIEARPGKESEVESFLVEALPIVVDEPGTAVWYALRLAPTSFAIFDAFADDAARQRHLAGRVAAALMARAPDLLARAPTIRTVDVLAEKLPR